MPPSGQPDDTAPRPASPEPGADSAPADTPSSDTPSPGTSPEAVPAAATLVADALEANQSRPHSETASERARREAHAQRLVLFAIRLVYLVLLASVALLPFVGNVTDEADSTFSDYAGAFVATFLFGVLILFVDALTPNKRLASVFGIYLGIVAGLVGALAIGALLDLVATSWDLVYRDPVTNKTTGPWAAWIGLAKLAIGITLCYLAVSIVLTTKDDFRLVVPYVEFAKQVRGIRPLLLDTSILIDGRIEAFAEAGFLDAPMVVPQFVIDELQTLADSSDRLKRARGRRGLEMVTSLQSSPVADVSIETADPAGHTVDHKLLRLAADSQLRVLTTDANLVKVAEIQGVPVLNLNELGNALRPQVLPGEMLTLDIVRAGEGADQGVGYLPDGTMVVVEHASERIGHSVAIVVTNALQTTAGRMVFGRLEEQEDGASRIARAATHQPRKTERPPRRGSGAKSHNPRRN